MHVGHTLAVEMLMLFSMRISRGRRCADGPALDPQPSMAPPARSRGARRDPGKNLVKFYYRFYLLLLNMSLFH